jgi:hypothetical protein
MVVSQSELLRQLNKNTIVFLNFILSKDIYKLHKSICQNLISSGHILTLVSCDRSVNFCSLNPFGFKSICKQCEIQSALLAAEIGCDSIMLSTVVSEQKYIPNNDLNEGVNSSISSLLRKSNLNSEDYFKRNFGHSSSKIFNAFFSIFLSKNIDNLFLFNGRFNCGRSAISAAENNGVNFFTYDYKKGESPFLFINTTVHNIKQNITILNLIEDNDIDIPVSNSFNMRINHFPTFEKVYTKKQVSGYFDRNYVIPKDKKIITFFLGSEDEFSYLGKYWEGKQYLSQINFIEILASKIDIDHFSIIVRMHPNQASSNRGELNKLIRQLQSIKNITLIYPADKVDSYELVKKSKVVISSMSFIGVESFLLGTPSFFISKCLYSEYIPNSVIYDVDCFISKITMHKISLDFVQILTAKKLYYFFAFLKSDLFENLNSILISKSQRSISFYFFKVINKFLLWIKV